MEQGSSGRTSAINNCVVVASSGQRRRRHPLLEHQSRRRLHRDQLSGSGGWWNIPGLSSGPLWYVSAVFSNFRVRIRRGGGGRIVFPSCVGFGNRRFPDFVLVAGPLNPPATLLIRLIWWNLNWSVDDATGGFVIPCGCGSATGIFQWKSPAIVGCWTHSVLIQIWKSSLIGY